jgi:hypothetical protein
MRKRQFKILFLGLALSSGFQSHAQSAQTLVDLNNFVSDALWYADKFITPATDAAVYQASSGWIATPQKAKLWDVNVSLHTNIFFVPKANRKFTVSNSDFAFLEIEGASSVTVPTAIGNDDQYYVTGSFTDVPNGDIRIKTPEGLDAGTVIYPYVQASLGLWYGTEILAKYSYNVKLKKGHYQVYGVGIKHNLSQYVKSLEAKNIYLSIFAGVSKEEIAFDFLTSETEQFGSLGLNEIVGLVDTYQFQVNGSKKWKKFELMAGVITNVSNIEYEVGGENGTTALLVPVKSFVNNRLSEIYKTKINSIGELSGRYQFGKHLFGQAAFAFGKFANTNISLQYEF